MIETGQPQTDLAADKGRTWTTDEMAREFEVIGFAAPFVVKRRDTAETGPWSSRTTRASTSAGGRTAHRR
jgi:hypothetical protein